MVFADAARPPYARMMLPIGLRKQPVRASQSGGSGTMHVRFSADSVSWN